MILGAQGFIILCILCKKVKDLLCAGGAPSWSSDVHESLGSPETLPPHWVRPSQPMSQLGERGGEAKSQLCVWTDMQSSGSGVSKQLAVKQTAGLGHVTGFDWQQREPFDPAAINLPNEEKYSSGSTSLYRMGSGKEKGDLGELKQRRFFTLLQRMQGVRWKTLGF